MSAKVWTKRLPLRPGLYLRNNPPAGMILKAQIVEVDGMLLNSSVNTGDSMVSLKHQKGFWWFGPIPLLPEDAALASIKEDC